MTLIIHCPKCGESITFSAVMGGIFTQCSKCRNYVELPGVTEVEPKRRIPWLAVGAALFVLAQVSGPIVWLHFRRAAISSVEENKLIGAVPAIAPGRNQTQNPPGFAADELQKILTNEDWQDRSNARSMSGTGGTGSPLPRP